VIRERLGFNDDSARKSFDEIGLNMGLTRERIRQLERKAAIKLRKLNFDWKEYWRKMADETAEGKEAE
jgi:DNA-directed RNA polymerase sigma subunit (sigma70/sigma32)